MKTLFALTIGFFAGAFLTESSFAGPEPIEPKMVAPAPVSDLCKWTGIYGGVHAGYGWGNLQWSDADTLGDNNTPEPNIPLVDHTQTGFFIGSQLGVNYQIGRFVIGGEGTFDYSEVRAHSALDVGDEPNIFDTRNDWSGTLALRVGITYNRFLFYARGGAAFAHLKYFWLHGESEVDGDEVIDSFKVDEVRVAPLVGVGIEYAINCNWSAKIEYNHIFFGSYDISGTRIDDNEPQPESFRIDLDQDSVQVGLNYKFWGWGYDHNPDLNFAGVDRLDSKSSKEVLQSTFEEPCNWTGFYIGAHLGYAGGGSKWTDADTNRLGDVAEDQAGEPDLGPEVLSTHDQDGFFTGGQVGYNRQFGSWFVIGAEGEFSYSEVRGYSDQDLDKNANIFREHNDWTGTAALRIGIAFHHFLFYAKGGGVFAHVNYSWLHGIPEDEIVEPFTADEVTIAPMAGGGIEYAINCHWSVKAEYNRLFYGAYDVTGTHIDEGVPEPETYQIDGDHDRVEVGLNFKF